MVRRQALICGILGWSLAIVAPAAAQPPDAQAGPYGQGPIPADSSMRLQVKPRETQVFVDGYFAGIADNFDGTFQRLHLDAGQHSVQLFLPGHRLFTQDVYLQPGNTFSVRHTMESLREGEPEPERPSGSAGVPRAATRNPAPPPPRDPGTAPPAPAADAPPRTDAYGALRIRVQPADGLLLIDGERWNGENADDVEIQLSAGRHTIEVRKAGYRAYLTEVTVAGRETTRLNIALSAEK